MSKIGLVVILIVVVVAACGTNPATESPHATMTFNSHTYDLSGGRCNEGNDHYWEVYVGDYPSPDHPSTSGDYLSLIIRASEVAAVAGRAGGTDWGIAAGKASGMVDTEGNGVFSGPDVVSGKRVSGTFGCS